MLSSRKERGCSNNPDTEGVDQVSTNDGGADCSGLSFLSPKLQLQGMLADGGSCKGILFRLGLCQRFIALLFILPIQIFTTATESNEGFC